MIVGKSGLSAPSLHVLSDVRKRLPRPKKAPHTCCTPKPSLQCTLPPHSEEHLFCGQTALHGNAPTLTAELWRVPAWGQMCRIQLVLNSIFSHVLQLPDCKPSSELQRRDSGTSAVQMQEDVSSQQFPYGPHLSGCLCSLRVEHSHWELPGGTQPHCVQNGLLLSSSLPCSALDCILIRMKDSGKQGRMVQAWNPSYLGGWGRRLKTQG